ncbi:hypothetical protein [Pandoraea pulmonicola]|uniref:Uncharacterized protein n=1 Tax=Pandoraea pulmonicola TaxID=93221 RepID=A0AAJ5CZ94_PANPU|nr:hypothetical protein [Pandoraea pulmonicola]AJC21748.1 hypothetical protein RO07_16970 [Pandoraea pulmonicola]SUA89363.1 Uncharacterised protein [Pandoraea pulmonicola]
MRADKPALAQALGVSLETLERYEMIDVLGNAAVSRKKFGERDYLQALEIAVENGSPLDAQAFADKYEVHIDKVLSDARTLKAIQEYAPSLPPESDWPSNFPPRSWSVSRSVEPQDLLALREERASGGSFDLTAWAERLGLSLHLVRQYVTEDGELTPTGNDLLRRSNPQNAG